MSDSPPVRESREIPLLPKRHKRKQQTKKRPPESADPVTGTAENMEKAKFTTIITTRPTFRNKGYLGIRTRHWITFLLLIGGLCLYTFFYSEFMCFIQQLI